MRFAVIAGGEGSRLREEGVGVPKPLVDLCGVTLLERLVNIFVSEGAREIVVAYNERHESVAALLSSLKDRLHDDCGVSLQCVGVSTPSGMHSLLALSQELAGEPFCLTTVDTIFKETDFHRYLQAFRQALNEGVDALMGVTDFVDDERPLYVETTDDMKVTAFSDSLPEGLSFVSGGIYGLTAKTLDVLQTTVDKGEMRMRCFQRALLTSGLNVRAFRFGKVIDIDHASDILQAERLVNEDLGDTQGVGKEKV